MSEKILTRHPQRKSGKNISREKYDQVRTAILAVLGRAELTHTELMKRLHERLVKRFDGNPHWYGETVKLEGHGGTPTHASPGARGAEGDRAQRRPAAEVPASEERSFDALIDEPPRQGTFVDRTPPASSSLFRAA